MNKFIFTDALFYDGVAWNYLKYDKNTDKIDCHIILNDKTSYNGYISYLNIVDTNVIPEIDGNNLTLTFDNGNCIVNLSIIKRKKLFFTKKYVKSRFEYIPKNLVYYGEIKHKKKLPVINNPKWDIIANFLNSS